MARIVRSGRLLRDFVLRDVEDQAARDPGGDERRAAVGHERQRNALRRHEREDDGEVDRGLDDDHRRRAGGEEGREGVRGAAGGPQAAPGDDAEARSPCRAAPTKPSSSPTIAKMKSVWGNGRKKSFCRLPPRPLPNQPPAPTAISDWIAWKPGAERVGLGVQKRQQARPPVVGREHQGREHREHREGSEEEPARPRAGQPQEHRAEHDVAGRRAEVRLQHDDAGGGQREDERRHERALRDAPPSRSCARAGSASSSTSATLRSSEGCSIVTPSGIHRRAPLIGGRSSAKAAAASAGAVGAVDDPRAARSADSRCGTRRRPRRLRGRARRSA